MSVNQLIYIYLLTIPVFFSIDLLWLGVFAKKFYQEQIGHLLGSVNWSAAIIFYLLYIVGIIFFAVYPALMASSFAKAVLLGALFGFFAYATYDLTNLATIEDWPLIMAVVDVIWGTVLTASVAGASYLLAKAYVL
jgi:uncharacterized membrane protein